MFINAIAVTQGCCDPVLQSSSKQRGVHFAQGKAAVHWCWVTAQLYEQQTFIDAIAVTQDYCEPVLQSSTERGECNFPEPVLQCSGVGSLHSCMNSKSSLMQLL